MRTPTETAATPPGSAAVWSLLLPAAEHVVCHAIDVPDVARELAARGTRVDLVSRCDLEAWNARPLAGTSRCLWEPDPDVDYDLALAWDPPSAPAARGWVAMLAQHPAPPREAAVWSRNPLHRGGVPPWWRIDGWLDAHGWRPGEAHVGLPAADRVRQVVAWDAWTRTPLVRHRRSHRAWKEWLVRSAAGRWTQSARLRRASLATVTPAPSVLASVLGDAGSAVGAPLHVERMLVSPNGVAIAIVTLLRPELPRRAVLKVPYAVAAEPRVGRNAAALEWIAAGAGGRAAAERAPDLLARGVTAGRTWTLEEWVSGSDAQGWEEPARARAFDVLGDLLATWVVAAGAPQPLDDATFERTCAAPIRAAGALLHPRLAARLDAARARLQHSLRDVPVPLVARHGDLKLENLLGDPGDAATWRLLDWELWTPRGLPLLDALHVVASKRAREAGCAMGTAVARWLLSPALSAVETRFLERMATGLDPRYVAAAPVLYWLDRIAPIAARGAWPHAGWEQANVAPVLEALPAAAVLEVTR
jgi:hypothetical protein